MKQWIFGSTRKDLFFLVLPGLLTAGLVHIFHPQGLWDEALAFFALAFCDSGHVYTTFWRTYANARERNRTTLYWTVPVLVFLFVAIWAYFNMIGLWTFIIFATVFHNYRQFHGILKWEQKINGDKDPWQARFLLALLILPFALFHFRDIDMEFVLHGAVLHFPNQIILQFGLVAYGVVLAAWVLKVLRSTFQGTSSAPVTLAVMIPSFLYGISFLVGDTIGEILYPLVVAHGFAYMGLMSLTLKRTEIPWRKEFAWWLVIIIGTAFMFGLLEAQFEDWFLPLAEKTSAADFTLAFLMGIYLTPLLSHYIYDGWLWKSNHHEAALIYKNS